MMLDQYMSPRAQKRSIIIAVYVAFFGLIGWALFHPVGSCTDGVRDQNETGVDCGGVCGACAPTFATPVDMEITSTNLVYGGVNTYDVVARVFNPNAEAGAESFNYTFTVKDDQGNVLATRQGRSFILPGETKYITETQIDSPILPKKIAFEISNVSWKHFVGGYQERPTLSLYSRNYSRIMSGPGFGEATGLLVNESPFDFVTIKVKVILFDATDKPIALNSTEFQTVKAGEKRDFRLVWPTAFPGEVARMEAEAEADVYRSDNFVKKYFPNSQF